MDKILLLEQDANVAQVLQEHLVNQNYDVILATNLDETRHHLAYATPDLLLIDLLIASSPEFLSFYQWLVEQPQYTNIPRLFLEGNENPIIRELKTRSRHDSFLKKPVKPKIFNAKLDELLAPKRNSQPPASEDQLAQQLDRFIGRQVGSAIVKKEIGRGGMGAVFSGYQESLDRKVAIKVMLPELINDSSAVGRFRREALAIARLKSPHIVQVFDAGLTEDEVFYIVMEFLEGGTLDEPLEQQGRFAVNKAVNIITQVAKGLYVAHDSHLIHRDIKPSNLILAPSGHVTITDFGLVRSGQDMRYTQTGIVVGTPHYLSPEQAYGRDVDHRSDIYSLGIVFYELLTGRVPFDSNNLTQVLLSHVQKPLPDPREIAPDIPESIVTILRLMTEKEVDDRFQDCRELYTALESLGFQTNFESGAGAVSQVPNPRISFAGSQAGSGVGQPISLNSTMARRLSSLKNVSLSQFNEENLEGAVWLNEAGSVYNHEGQFGDDWTNTLLVLSGHAQQISEAVGYSEWQHTLFESQDKIMAIFPKDQHTCAMLFPQKSNQTSMNLQAFKNSGTRPGTFSGVHPLEQILSVAGVEGALLFDEVGQLQDLRCKQNMDRTLLEIRLLPIVHILQTLPRPMVGLDCWFEQGRVMVWHVGQKTLFVLAGVRVNKAMLSILIGRQVEQLQVNSSDQQTEGPKTIAIQSLDSSSFGDFSSDSMQVQIPEGVDVFPRDVIISLQEEYAKSIGPIAKLAMKQQLKKMGYSRKTLPKEQGRKLVEELALRLEPPKRAPFVEKGLELIAGSRSAKK